MNYNIKNNNDNNNTNNDYNDNTNEFAGMTLEYVIVQICQREYSPGLFYTGCSRVKDMEKLAIVGYSERTLNNGETTWFPPIQRLV